MLISPLTKMTVASNCRAGILHPWTHLQGTLSLGWYGQSKMHEGIVFDRLVVTDQAPDH